MNKTYLVTDGSYSDYGIVGSFSSKEKAESYVEKFGGRVETFDVDSELSELKRDVFNYRVEMNKKGDVVKTKCSTGERESTLVGISHSYFSSEHGNLTMNVYCSAKDEDHAIKIAGEIRTRILAANEWKKCYLWDGLINRI